MVTYLVTYLLTSDLQDTVDQHMKFCSIKFLSPEAALYLYKTTICPCMKYGCYVWAGAPSCHLEFLDKLQKRICRGVSPSLATSLEPLAHC